MHRTDRQPHGDLALKTVGTAAWLLLPVPLGITARLRAAYMEAANARAEHAERTREEEARHRVADERMRIARELHDVTAHHLALANAQVGTVIYLMDTEPGKARADGRGPQRHDRRGTGGTQGHRRAAPPADDPESPLEPAPGLAQLPGLADSFGSAGLTVTITTEGEPQPLSPGVDLTAFRIIQEALTNVTKHAATSDAQVRLDLRRRPAGHHGHQRQQRSSPRLPRRRPWLRADRHARAGPSVGGRLQAGHRPAGGFEVVTELPLPPRRPHEDQTPMTIRVLLADDQALLRQTFRILISATPDMEVVAEAADGKQAAEFARAHHPDVVVMDIRMPGTDGLAATEAICADPDLAGTRILILTTFETDEYVARALRAGASGFLGKTVSTEDLLAGIRTVAAGDSLLSPQATRALITRFLATPEPGGHLAHQTASPSSPPGNGR